MEDLARRLRDGQRVNPLQFAGGASEPEIAAAEAALGVTFPESFRWFLREFGGGEVFVEIFGVGSRPSKTVVGETQRLRRGGIHRLPRNLVVFGAGHQWVEFNRWVPRHVCFDLSRRKDQEFTVTECAPGARWRERITRTGQTFLEWLSEQLDALDRFTESPRDWTDAAAWERYWSKILSEPHRRQWDAWHIGPDILLGYLATLRRRRLHRILCAGNGISLEPYCLRHCGFDVTVVDVSTTASQFVRGAQVSENELTRFLPEYEVAKDEFGIHVGRVNETASLGRVAREYRVGGRLDVITVDLFQYSPEQPFHVTYSRRAFQGFLDGERRELARRFFDWTLPGGLCLVETLNVYNASDRQALDRAFLEAGFFLHRAETDAWYERNVHKLRWSVTRAASRRLQQEYEARAAAEEERELQRLDSGEKMAVVGHGSG
jgi:hypothetical protein